VTKPTPAGPDARSTARPFSALAHRNYRLLWVGLIISNVGTWMQLAAQSWLIHELTGRATDLGVLGLARAVPLIVLSLVGGTLADRLEKRRLLYLTQSLAAAFALLQGLLAHAGWIQVWHIWALGFLSATVLAFDQPTRQAMLPQLVPREDFMSAITLFALTFNGASVLGPALAGLLVPAAGYASTFYLNGVSFAAVLVALALIRLPVPAPRPPQPPILRQVADGLRYIWRSDTVRALTLLAAAFGLFGAPYNAMLPVYKTILGIDERALGVLSSAPGLGTILGGLVLARFAHVAWKGKLVLGAVGCFVLTLIAFANSPWYLASVALLVGVGACTNAFASTTQTLLQHATDDRMRGRVVSMYTVTVIGFQPLGALDLGWAIDRLGAPLAISLASLLVGLIALGMASRVRDLQ
jgi:MFS family permease